MDVSFVSGSNMIGQSSDVSMIKKANKVQEQQIQEVLQGMEQTKQSQANSLASQSTGVGINLNALA